MDQTQESKASYKVLSTIDTATLHYLNDCSTTFSQLTESGKQIMDEMQKSNESEVKNPSPKEEQADRSIEVVEEKDEEMEVDDNEIIEKEDKEESDDDVEDIDDDNNVNDDDVIDVIDDDDDNNDNSNDNNDNDNDNDIF